MYFVAVLITTHIYIIKTCSTLGRCKPISAFDKVLELHVVLCV